MKYPKVSIIIPCYNYHEYISDCILSCMEQKYPGEIETIVIDDASTDRSVAVIHCNFPSELQQGRLKLIKLKRNQGYSAAKNRGITSSFGSYITTVDADDMLTPDSVAVRANYLSKVPSCMLVHAHAYSIYGEGGFTYWVGKERKLRNKLIQTKRWNNPDAKIHAQSVMVRREVYRKFGLYDEDLRSKSDNEYWERLRSCGLENNMHRIEYPVAFYRKHDKSMIQMRRKNPEYNKEVQMKCDRAKMMRRLNGPSWGNVRFLRD